jgi:hypothetical protein
LAKRPETKAQVLPGRAKSSYSLTQWEGMHVINFSFTPPSLSQQQQQQQPAQLQFCAELLFFFSMLALRVKICPRGPLSLAFHKKGEFASIF